MKDLLKMFSPNSIAVIGVSSSPKKLGSIVFNNLLDFGFSGQVFPLNPKEVNLYGHRVYHKYSELPLVPDLVLVAIPAKFVLTVVQDCLVKGTRNIVIFSAGFKEAGASGRKLEKELLVLARKYQANILGPNCLGFVNSTLDLNATFGQVEKNSGSLRFISQSGAIATSIFDWSSCNRIGFREFVTLGNKMDIDESDVLAYFNKNNSFMYQKGDSKLAPVGMYLESIVNGSRFIETVKKITKKHPVFVLKPGKSSESKKAMQSHTGAIAGEDYVFTVAMQKAGVIRCDGVEDFFDLAKVFSWEKVPKGKNIAIISNAGGPAVLSSDFVVQEGLNLVSFDSKIEQKLAELLPRASSIINPVDVLGDALAERYKDAIQTLIADDKIDSLLIILTPQVMTQIEETAKVIGELSLQYDKPIVCSFMGGSLVAKGEKVLNKYRVPSFKYPERAVKVLAKSIWWSEWQQRQQELEEPKVILDNYLLKHNIIKKYPVKSKIIDKVSLKDRKILDSLEANQVLQSIGINTPKTKLCYSCKEAINFVDEVGYPVVLKISSLEVLHKSDSGGVITGINNEEDLITAFTKLTKMLGSLDENNHHGVQIQQQVNKGVELIIGAKKDETFGFVVSFGAGGVLANLIEDRNLILLPLTKLETIELVKHSKVFKILNGYRGQKKYDLSLIIDLLLKLQLLLINNPSIKELDINPVIFNTEGLWAVDGKILLL